MTCPVCASTRLAVVSLPGAGPTGQVVCLTCAHLWTEGDRDG